MTKMDPETLQREQIVAIGMSRDALAKGYEFLTVEYQNRLDEIDKIEKNIADLNDPEFIASKQVKLSEKLFHRKEELAIFERLFNFTATAKEKLVIIAEQLELPGLQSDAKPIKGKPLAQVIVTEEQLELPFITAEQSPFESDSDVNIITGDGIFDPDDREPEMAELNINLRGI